MCKYSKLKFKLSFEYLRIYSPKSQFLQKKKQNCSINVLSKVRFTENIEIQPELDPV